MRCPGCLEKVEGVPVEEALFKTRYKCPNCGIYFGKRTWVGWGLYGVGALASLAVFGEEVGGPGA